MTKQKDKKITVAIPTYNRKEYLHECLESLNLQTFKNFKIIIFDNNSNYDVNIFISNFPTLDIQIERNEYNIGNLANFEKIVKYDFNSPYVVIFHDDDTIHPAYFEAAISCLEKNSQIVWVGSNIDFIKKENFGKMQYFNNSTSINTFIELNQQELIKKIMGGLNLGFGSIVYRSEILKKATLRTKEFDKWSDRPFMIDLISNRIIAITYGKFMHYRIHPNQDSQVNESLKLRNIINLFTYYREMSVEGGTQEFKRLENNNSIISVTENSRTSGELFSFLKILKNEGFFSFKKISLKGVYYFLKFIIKTYIYKKY